MSLRIDDLLEILGRVRDRYSPGTLPDQIKPLRLEAEKHVAKERGRHQTTVAYLYKQGHRLKSTREFDEFLTNWLFKGHSESLFGFAISCAKQDKSDIDKVNAFFSEANQEANGKFSDAYPHLRHVPEITQEIRQLHKALTCHFQKWLRKIGAIDIRSEADGIDIYCNWRGNLYLFELKACSSSLSIRHALREALGQALDYAFYPGRIRPGYLAIVIDEEPNVDDIKWFRNLQQVVSDIEVFWLANNNVYSAHVSRQPLAEKANCSG